MLEKTYRINSYDVSPDGLVKVSALQKYMQQLAREDSNSYGATYSEMRKRNMVFVLTKLGLEIYKEIKSEDIITIRTFSNRIMGVHFDREYLFYKNQELAAAASTLWVLLNYEKRTVIRPKMFDFPIISYNKDVDFIEVPRRIFNDNLPTKAVGKRKVVYSDLDENNHLNNCVYSDIALDYSPIDLDKHSIRKALIVFLNEARLGDELNISVSRSEDSYCISAYNIAAEKQCFEAQLFFTKNT